jgi:hypothetical protein
MLGRLQPVRHVADAIPVVATRVPIQRWVIEFFLNRRFERIKRDAEL